MHARPTNRNDFTQNMQLTATHLRKSFVKQHSLKIRWWILYAVACMYVCVILFVFKSVSAARKAAYKQWRSYFCMQDIIIKRKLVGPLQLLLVNCEHNNNNASFCNKISNLGIFNPEISGLFKKISGSRKFLAIFKTSKTKALRHISIYSYSWL